MLIGLDYGTTTSLAFSWQGGVLKEEVRCLSSVFIKTDGEILTDEAAYEMQSSSEGKYVHSPKTLLGREDVFAEGQLPNGITPKNLVCATLTSMFNKLQEKLEEGEKVRITLTVPNAWKDRQYILMRDCVFSSAKAVFGDRFDGDNFSILPEPVAAALRFVIDKPVFGGEDRNYAVVCDVGGGTSDLAVVEYTKNQDENSLNFEVICPMEGAPGLGGDNFDKAIRQHLFPDGIPSGVPEHVVWKSIRTLKSSLSSSQNVQFPLTVSSGEPYRDKRGNVVMLSCSRADFESWIKDPLDRLDNLLEELKNKLLKKDPRCDLKRVCLLPVGGSCRIPALRSKLQKKFEAELQDIDNETYDSIAAGAAYYSAWRAGEIKGYREISIKCRLPHRLSVLWAESKLETLVEKNSPDGTYEVTMHPVRSNPDGRTFNIGKFSIYQGEGDFVSDKNEMFDDLQVPENMHTHGRQLDEIDVKITIKLTSSRISEIGFLVPGGMEDGNDCNVIRTL